MKKISSLSVFFPAFNDGGTIASMIVTALIAARKVTDQYEVVVINDGSADYTGLVLAELAQQYPSHVRILTHEKNKGYGEALRSGFEAAQNDWVFYTDGDAQYDAFELVNLVQGLNDNVDVVNGYKIGRSDTWVRIIIGRLYHHIVKLLFGFKLRDVDCDFRLIRKSALENIHLTSSSGTICLELVKKLQDAGFRFVEVPVHHYHRAYGQSQFFNFKRLWRTGIQLIQLWYELVILKSHLNPEKAVVKKIEI
jgi:glycosyltransferase involved in cell wall biosynthesis